MKQTRNVDEIAAKLASKSGIVPEIGNGAKQPGRMGKANLQSWHDPAVIQQLKIIAAEQDKTQQKLIAEALNMFFRKYGKQEIA